jgi:hypothetical protein
MKTAMGHDWLAKDTCGGRERNIVVQYPSEGASKAARWRGTAKVLGGQRPRHAGERAPCVREPRRSKTGTKERPTASFPICSARILLAILSQVDLPLPRARLNSFIH